jgi:hypothetical protein
MLLDPAGPAMLGTMRPIVAALVGAYLLRHVSSAGGSRVGTGAVDEAIGQLERAVSRDVRAHCREEARRIARWTQEAASEPPPRSTYADELERIGDADLDSRVSVMQWAVAQELDLEMEWYDADEDYWPRERVRPLEVDTDGAPTLHVRFGSDDRAIPVVHIRWLMPVERRPDHRVAPPEATVLPFRRPDDEE